MKQWLLSIFTVLMTAPIYSSFIPVQFYYPKFICSEPRLAKDFLSTIDAIFSTGSTHHLFDQHGKKVNVHAHFRFNQILVVGTQNFCNGWNASAFLPLRSISLRPKRGARTQSGKKTGLSDPLLLAGYTCSMVENPHFDFIDLGLQAGISIPASGFDHKHPFFLPLGFDGHWAGVFSGNIACGIFDWVTVGMYADMLAFVPHTKKIAGTSVRFHRSVQYSIAGYFKADHFSRGFSFTGCYSFTYQGSTHARTHGDLDFHRTVDGCHLSPLASWHEQVLHAGLEYDFTGYGDVVGPRVGIFYDRPVSGKNIFFTSLWNGTVGIDICWQF